MSDFEILALGKGLNFIPNPEKPRKNVLMEAADMFARSMRIRYLAKIKGWGPRHKFRNPSTWTPGQTESVSLEDYLEGMRTELSKVPIKNIQPNITKAELQAIKALKSNPDIVLKKYDKGRGICIVSKIDYVEEGLRHLKERKSYLKLDYDMTSSTANMVSELVCEMFDSKEIDKALADYLDPETSYETKTPVFFMLPKIHKVLKEEDKAKGRKFYTRPVISSCGSPLNRIAELLDFYLLPEVKKSPAYLKDTADTIRKIETLVLPENVILASINIVSMFTTVNQEEAYETAMKTLAKVNQERYDPPMPSMHYSGKLLKLVLYRNAFEFNGEFYLQVSGCPIGLRSNPSLCCLVVNELVEKIKNLDKNVHSFNIFMDDSFLTWTGTMKELENFIERINGLSETIKFTYTASETEVQFLDLVIYKGERFRTSNILDIKCHTKSTETWCYLDRNSCHSPSVFKGFIRGKTVRYARNTSSLAEFEKKSVFKEKLVARGYSNTEIEKASKEVKFEDRQQYIAEKQSNDKIPLVFKTNYFPHIDSKHIKNALLKHWEIISDNPELSRIYPDIPIIAYSRTKNLKDDLVRARLRVNRDEESEIDLEQSDSRPGSPTLHILQDLEMESRGLNDFFPSNGLFQNDTSRLDDSQTSEMSENSE